VENFKARRVKVRNCSRWNIEITTLRIVTLWLRNLWALSSI